MTRAETELIQMTKERCENARTRTPWRHRQKGQFKLTNIQKAQRKIANLDRKETLNQLLQDARDKVMDLAGEMQKHFPRHTDKYYFHLIMQESCLHAKSHSPSRWNTFLSQEMERRNADVTVGRKNVSQDAASQDIAAMWRSMTKEEQVAATEDRMQLIADRRLVRTHKIPTAPIQIFHDTRATTQRIENELKALNTRTGRNALLIMTSPNATDYGQPYVFYTSQRIVDFAMLTMRSTLPEFAMKMEGYILSCVQGLKQSYQETILTLKHEASRLINEKLREVSGGVLTKVMYKNFDTHITENVGITVERWPLPTFRAPGDISSSVELQTLIDAWTTGATYFRVMGEEELREWRCQRRSLQPLNVGDGDDASMGQLVTSGIDALESSPSPAPASPASSATHPMPASTPGTTPPLLPSPSLTESPECATTIASLGVFGLRAPAASSAPLLVAVSSPALSPPALPDTISPAAGVPTSKMHTRFINVDVVTGPDGKPLGVMSRPRKTRSDKGKRKSKPAGDASTTTQSKSHKKSKVQAV
uniref:Mitogen-activated protein kinase (EC) n=1 Tax=Ganoderma boninense TaxID=34458 RepID=A0A5K1JVS7_9APHY|nr:Mitogen-activated protein kinase (EC [Ganoderma boninense]